MPGVAGARSVTGAEATAEAPATGCVGSDRADDADDVEDFEDFEDFEDGGLLAVLGDRDGLDGLSCLVSPAEAWVGRAFFAWPGATRSPAPIAPPP